LGGRIAAAVLLASCLLPLKATLAQGHDPSTAPADRSLEERIQELEAEKLAREDATRSIIAESLSRLGSRINEFVDFGGVIEVLPGWEQDFEGGDRQFIELNTLELQFEIQVAQWARGSVVLEYADGRDQVFTTTEDDEFSIDRINVDTAFLTIGDTTRLWPYASFGRMVVPFGISTGDPVADVLNIVDPLTVEIFETKKDAILIGLDFPTPRPTPQVVTPAPPPVRPVAVAPLVGKLSRALGYRPPPPPHIPRFTSPPPDLPPFTLGVYFYSGNAHEKPSEAGSWDPGHHLGATAGYRTRGKCRPYLGGEESSKDLSWLHVVCPWTLEIDVDYNGSVFDSDFLSFDYRNMLGPKDDPSDIRFGLQSIGFIPGLAASLKTSLGPVAIVAEWNGALETANFQQDDGQPISIQPSAWQVSVAYQFGWKPWVEAIGAQGTYLTVGYSESRDLGGVRRINANDFTPFRVGAVPEKRLVVGVGEWVLPNLRLALEYARAWDYPDARARFADLGNPPIQRTANAVLSMVTFEW
jgi:hypothetical protein